MDATRLLLRPSVTLIGCRLLLSAISLGEDVELYIQLVDESGVVDFDMLRLLGAR